MKKMVPALVVILGVFSPALAHAGSATDAALGLGAFAVFNQILSGTGIFGGLHAAPAPIVVAPPPPVVVAPPPAVVVAPPPPVVVAPAPVIVAPAPPVFVGPAPPVAYYVPARAYYAPHARVVVRGWCPPGRAGHRRCY
jgi:hypothetical protein